MPIPPAAHYISCPLHLLPITTASTLLPTCIHNLDLPQSEALIMNGVIMGVKGILSFLSAPLIGALSDVWGRKIFLFITAFFTCLPIPFLLVSRIQ